jgi:AbrB family looped-hinge helix DNA binding protein
MNQRPYFATIDTQGQVIIPPDLREHLGIVAGDQISMTSTEQGLLIEPYADVLKRLRGKYKTISSAVQELLEERRIEAKAKGF